MRKAFSLLLLLSASLALSSCDKAGPVAPEGSVLTISASPDRIPATGSSQITVTARKSNGFPVNPGTTVFFSTTRGVLPQSKQTDDAGLVQVTLQGNGDVGKATVKANAGAAEEAMTEVQIGVAATSLTLQASPSSVTSAGGEITLVTVVRDETGQPLAGAGVNFTSQLGTLESGGRVITSNAAGEAVDKLRVRASDVASTTAATFNVGVEAAGADGKLITRTTPISIQRSSP
jgi:adhesin/invasin